MRTQDEIDALKLDIAEAVLAATSTDLDPEILVALMDAFACAQYVVEWVEGTHDNDALITLVSFGIIVND